MSKQRIWVVAGLSLLLCWSLMPVPSATARHGQGMPPGQAKKIYNQSPGYGPPPGQAAPRVKHGPPPWSPAHGRRAKYMYRYYPRSRVYYDPGRRLWFWLAGANWLSGPRLPNTIRLNVTGMVRLGMDVDRPYSWHRDVLRYFPPPR